MKNFEIGKEIKAILASNQQVTWLVGDKIFPLVATNTTFPFVVYNRNYYTPQGNKDYESERVGIEIDIASAKYDESVTVANAIAEALNHQSTDIIDDIILSNASEGYQEDTYIQSLSFDISLKD